MNNIMEVKFSAKSENESLARVIVASFAAKLDPTLDELADIKTAVSEAVTNSIIHGYDEDDSKFVCNHFIHQNQNLKDQEWGSLLWKVLWMI